MSQALAIALFAAAGSGLLALMAQLVVLRRHVHSPGPAAGSRPGISILKPLCGADDDLAANLASFASLDYPQYEVLLGVRSPADRAWPVALAAARRWPGRFRAVVQRGEPGLNPKVNQLVTLARAARHDLLVVSDSNVRVPPGYLAGIADRLEDQRVGLVTHPIAGVGERRLGSLFDNLHLAGCISPGMVAAKRLGGRDLVVGKSMALRRRDLEALGGFEAVKDVLAEDYVLGSLVPRVLGKRVVIAAESVENVSRDRSLRDFHSRYSRWAVMQRTTAGLLVHSAQILLNPVLLAVAAVAAHPGLPSLAGLALVSAAKTAIDGLAARALRPGGFRPSQLLLVPAKDLLFGLAWAHGLLSDRVDWRGNRLRVLAGTRLARPEPTAAPADVLAAG